MILIKLHTYITDSTCNAVCTKLASWVVDFDIIIYVQVMLYAPNLPAGVLTLIS